MQKIGINDLLNTFNAANTVSNNKEVKPAKVTEQFVTQTNMKVKKIKKSDELLLKRSYNYKATQQQMDKWVGIVKLNRQKQSLNLSKNQRDDAKVNFFPSKPISQLQSKADKILSQLNMQNQSTILKNQERQLNEQNISPQQAKKRLIQARKHRTTIFYEEIKRRRISKIKSKLYHRIKKRQRVREEGKRIQLMGPEQKSLYLQNLTKKRIQQRINLRHNTKNKHIQNLLRFSKFNKNAVQTSVNEVNAIRKKQLQKAKINEEALQNISQEYDDQNYRQEAIKDLQKQLQQMQQQADEQQKGINAMKFMKIAKQKQKKQQMQDAYKMLNSLQNENQQEIFDSEGQLLEESQQLQIKIKNQDLSRKKFGGGEQQKKFSSIKQKGGKDFIKKNIINQLYKAQEDLTEGINLKNLKDKYQPKRIDLKISEEIISQNRQIFNDLSKQAILQNLKDFQQDKIQTYEQQIQSGPKKAKGWGTWAGPNIKQKKVDPALQIKKKLAKIQEIKRKRTDGQLINVQINQVRNKALKDYLVQKIPHNFKSAEQFDYMNRQQLGPEWNSMTQWKDNIKPKVITKVGQVIQPIKAPKHMSKG